MESIALGYLNIDKERIKSLKDEHRGNTEAFNRDIIKEWAYKNSGPDEVENLATLLHKAAKECSYVDPRKIHDILGVPFSTTTGSQATEIKKEELPTLAEKIRPFTEQAMKIEVVPWIKDYVVDMDELYTKLTLEKIHNKVTGERRSVVKDYKELFAKCLENDDDDDDDISEMNEHGCFCFCRKKPKQIRRVNKKYRLSKRAKGKIFRFPSEQGDDRVEIKGTKKTKEMFTQSDTGEKILGKGDPGMGKTTWCKKVAYDWAKGLFQTFSIVFFVFLKLVKPGAAIQNIIIEQNPHLKGLKMTNRKLENILETFGNRCLLILDGLDEHALGSNQDVLRIIRGEKLLSCNIIVTSRPHSTKGIEKYFPGTLRVEGFTRTKAKQFASKILSDEHKVNAVLQFNPTNTMENVPIHKSPILLSFLCLLVREDEIDLSASDMHIDEIYLRMVRCLYRKFTIRKGIEFNYD